MVSIDVLKDNILNDIRIVKDNGDDIIYFDTLDNKHYKMYHEQDCCESVYIESIVGDIKDLLNTPILMAEEASNGVAPNHRNQSKTGTWTFYKLATINGYVTIRWFGDSNGYYSESVYFSELKD